MVGDSLMLKWIQGSGVRFTFHAGSSQTNVPTHAITDMFQHWPCLRFQSCLDLTTAHPALSHTLALKHIAVQTFPPTRNQLQLQTP